MTKLVSVQPEGWAKALGYSNGIVGRGRVLFVAGQIGWNTKQEIVSDDLVEQFAQALDNVIAVVRAAGGDVGSIARMTIYTTSVAAYRAATRVFGTIWRERMGKHFPAMALVGVTELVEPRARIEIEATAVLDEELA